MGEIKDFIKLTLNHPQDVPKLRDKIRNLDSVKDILEHDIPFYRRYLIDKAIFPMAEVEVDGTCIDNKSINFMCSTDVCVFEMNGNGVYGKMKFESGVHRVQRIPETEKNGRIHTSTASVAILPYVEPKEFEITTFTSFRLALLGM